MRTTSIALTLLAALAFAPLAAASGCTPFLAQLDTPTGQHASVSTYSCDTGSASSDDGNVRVQDNATGQTVYAYGHQSESEYHHGNTTSSHESYGYGAGAYNSQGNLVPSFWISRGAGEHTYNGSPYSWDHGQAHVAWGPFYQSVDLGVLP